MRFLIDECLSTDLVLIARHEGYEAQHVAHVGKAGWQDWNVARHAHEGDFTVVTNNARDFLKLYAAQELHSGLVILLPSVDRVTQKRLFTKALSQLSVIGEPINQVLEIELDGQDITINFYALPKDGEQPRQSRRPSAIFTIIATASTPAHSP